MNWIDISKTGVVPENMSLLAEEREFNIVRAQTITEEKTGKKKMRLTGIIQKADALNENGRVYSSKILEEAVESIQPAVRARKVLGELDHACLTSDDFKVLTVDGWKKFRDLKIGDYVWSRVNGSMIKSRINDIIDQPYSGDVYNVVGRHINAEFTAPHKIIMDTRSDGIYSSRQVESTIEDIFNNRKKYDKHRIPRVAEWSGVDQLKYIIPGVPENELPAGSKNRYKNDVTAPLVFDIKTFVSFLGLYLAEGCIGGNCRIDIAQLKDDYKPMIRELLSEFPDGLEWHEYDNGFSLYDIRLNRYLKVLGNKYTKYIPEDVKQLDAPYLKELVCWFQVGDGRKKHGRSNVFSVSRKLVDDLHECWVKSGGCCYSTTIITEEDYDFAGRIIKAENTKPLHQLTLSTTTGIYLDQRFCTIEKKHYDGNVYCLTTEHGNFYIEHNGCSYWTGNSDAKIHMDRVSHLMTKVWMEDTKVLGELEVLEEMPCGQMLSALVRAGVTVGISSRGVGDLKPVMKEDMNEVYEVQPGYRFITWDTVAEPSVKEAELSVMESIERTKRKASAEERLIKAIREQFGE